MPLAFLLDEHLRGPLWQAIVRHNATGGLWLDVVCVGDPADLALGASDPEILQWAERESRLVVTEDRHTMPAHLEEHLEAGRQCHGILILRQDSPRQTLVECLELIAHAGLPDEFRNAVHFIP
jgi:hypothetical protein